MIGDPGVLFALVAAFAIAGQVMGVRLGTEEGSSNDALVVVLLVNIAILVPYAAVTYYPDYQLTTRAVGAFVGAGIVGTLLGRAFYYAGIERVGASRAEPIKASMPLHATLLAVVLLGESLTLGHLGGIVLIVLGVAVISREARSNPDTGDVPWRHLLLPLAGAFFFGIEPIFAKAGFAEGTPIYVGLAVKTLAATVGFVGYLGLRDSIPAPGDLARGPVRWYLVAGLANTTFLVAYYAALDATRVVVVVPIVQTSPLVVIALTYLFLDRLETVTPRLATAASIVVAGAVAVTVFG